MRSRSCKRWSLRGSRSASTSRRALAIGRSHPSRSAVANARSARGSCRLPQGAAYLFLPRQGRGAGADLRPADAASRQATLPKLARLRGKTAVVLAISVDAGGYRTFVRECRGRQPCKSQANDRRAGAGWARRQSRPAGLARLAQAAQTAARRRGSWDAASGVEQAEGQDHDIHASKGLESPSSFSPAGSRRAGTAATWRPTATTKGGSYST